MTLIGEHHLDNAHAAVMIQVLLSCDPNKEPINSFAITLSLLSMPNWNVLALQTGICGAYLSLMIDYKHSNWFPLYLAPRIGKRA